MSWWLDPPQSLEGMQNILERRMHMLKSPTDEGQALRLLIQRARNIYDSEVKKTKEDWQIAYWQPSYEQCLILNAWLFGIDFPITFAANRIGKTVAKLINIVLWIYPNDPNWRMFKPYVDEYGQICQVFPRPPLANIRKIQDLYTANPKLHPDPRYAAYRTDIAPPNSIWDKRCNNTLISAPEHQPERSQRAYYNSKVVATLQEHFEDYFKPAFPSPPLQTGGQIWLGAPDVPFHRNIVFKRLKSILPAPTILSWSDAKLEIIITTLNGVNPTPTVQHIIGKSYEAEDTKWSGDAVHGIFLTEGFTSAILSEVKNRLAEPAFASWDYTPYEARNVGAKTALAYRVMKGEEEMPLKSYVFRKFSVRNSPSHVVPTKKREDMIRMWDGKPEGVARLDGDFFASSGLILSSLNKSLHCLPWTFEELLEKRPRHQLYRGIDPGLDHPTVCWWALLDDTNTWFFYRCYSKRNTTISERCRDIISLSHNEQHKFTYGKGKDDYYIQEIHSRPNSEIYSATVTDYKMFKRDENTGQNYSLHYQREGLNVIPSVTMGPEERALLADSMLDANNHKFHPHPIHNVPPGARIYFLINEFGVAAALQTFDQLFWDRYRSGDYVGQPKDKVPEHGDDELDGMCNLICGPFSYTGHTGFRNDPKIKITEVESLNMEQMVLIQ